MEEEERSRLTCEQLGAVATAAMWKTTRTRHHAVVKDHNLFKQQLVRGAEPLRLGW